MCELFGVSSREDFYANDYLKAFYAHSDFHPHGWGLACVSRNSALVEKESVKASTSNYLRERLSQPITEKLLLAHIRYATIGNVEYKNCHPFTGRDSTGRRWTLIHNGTIFDYPALYPYLKTQKGDTDSERGCLKRSSAICQGATSSTCSLPTANTCMRTPTVRVRCIILKRKA